MPDESESGGAWLTLRRTLQATGDQTVPFTEAAKVEKLIPHAGLFRSRALATTLSRRRAPGRYSPQTSHSSSAHFVCLLNERGAQHPSCFHYR